MIIISLDMSIKAAFLDRDGVINKDLGYLYRREDFTFVNGAIEGLRYLVELKYELFIITNQSGIARGFYTEKDFLELDKFMKSELFKKGITIKQTFFCPHHPMAKIEKYRVVCDCRKPKPGLLHQVFSKYNIDKSKSFLIGDKETDIEAGRSAKIKSLLFNTNNLHKYLRSKIKS